jgi:agmatine deiminase
MSNANNVNYTTVFLPLTQNNVTTQTGTALLYKGSYVNYYVANNRVLVPNYNDPNDTVANAIISGLYPGRTVVGIDVRNLYENGGMVHCVTQQQPAVTLVSANFNDKINFKISPNPVKNNFQIQTENSIETIEITNELGQIVKVICNYNSDELIAVSDLANGVYIVKVGTSDAKIQIQKFIKE